MEEPCQTMSLSLTERTASLKLKISGPTPWIRSKKFGFMIPQVIGVDELSETKKMADEVGLPDNVKLGIMVETPAAVQLINQLCESGIKFISFGTNDLTQYTLAIDRNNPEVQHLYNEMHPAVLNSISYVIRRCKKYGVETSICGQAGSREDMAKFLLEQGIDSISCNADAAYNVSKIVSEIEGKLVNVESSVGKYPDKENEKKEENLMISHVKKLPIVDKDMEQVILSELENEYNPGTTSEGDTPNLNDAIGIGSDSFEEKKDDKILDFEN
jgi:signal transduction protein with GAF and PtsI domain